MHAEQVQKLVLCEQCFSVLNPNKYWAIIQNFESSQIQNKRTYTLSLNFYSTHPFSMLISRYTESPNTV